MNIEEFREYCLRKPYVTEAFPFNESTLVFKVGGKMFALCDVDSFESINLKSHPEDAEELRAQYWGIQPGYHMNKRHWNSVVVDSDVDTDLLFQLIDNSYKMVFEGLPKRERSKLL